MVDPPASLNRNKVRMVTRSIHGHKSDVLRQVTRRYSHLNSYSLRNKSRFNSSYTLLYFLMRCLYRRNTFESTITKINVGFSCLHFLSFQCSNFSVFATGTEGKGFFQYVHRICCICFQSVSRKERRGKQHPKDVLHNQTETQHSVLPKVSNIKLNIEHITTCPEPSFALIIIHTSIL